MHKNDGGIGYFGFDDDETFFECFGDEDPFVSSKEKIIDIDILDEDEISLCYGCWDDSECYNSNSSVTKDSMANKEISTNDDEAKEKVFDRYCGFLSSDALSLDSVVNSVVNDGYDKDEFLTYYHKRKSDIDEARRLWRKYNWVKVLEKMGDTPDSKTLCFNTDELRYCMKHFSQEEF